LKAIFLDRDGVLLEDNGYVKTPSELTLLSGVSEALISLKAAGYLLVLVTNQAVVARGLITEAQLTLIHEAMQKMLAAVGAPCLDAIYACPHHPNATDLAYRQTCECRKPNPGLLFAAAGVYQIDMAQSFMIGDRVSDIIAGQSAGCQTVLVTTGQHLAPPIESSSPIKSDVTADYVCENLLEAAHWILRKR
jgi:D-glycero-D-manno-heptose 1,7-bisphosphate phosphatase